MRSCSLEALADEIRRIEGGFGNPRLRRHIPTGIAAVDEQLPGGGIAGGALHELLATAEGCGLRTWALWLARQAAGCPTLCGASDPSLAADSPRCKGWGTSALGPERHRHKGSGTGGGYILWIDPAGDFYPPAAWAWGIDPQRLVLVRPRDRKDAFWAMDQALRCRGVAAVVGSLQPHPGRVRGVPKEGYACLTRAEARRLQLAAETGGGVGLLLRVESQNVKTSKRQNVETKHQSSDAEHSLTVRHAEAASDVRVAGASIGVASRWRITPERNAHPGAPGQRRGEETLCAGACPPWRAPLREISSRPAEKLPDSDAARHPQWNELLAGGGQRFTLEVLRCRGGHAVAPILVEVSRDAGLIAVSAGVVDRSRAPADEPAQLADFAASADRKSRRVRSA